MESFNIGRTLLRTVQLVRQSVAGAGLFVLLCSALSLGVQALSASILLDQIRQVPTAADPLAGLRIFASGPYWLTFLASFVLGAFSFGGSTFGMVQSVNGRPAGLAECATTGLAKLGPVFVVVILTYLGFMLGLILLVVPGIIVLLMWSVATPALLAEDIGILRSFGRSRQLTKGSRGKIALTLLLTTIVVYGAMFAVLGLASGTGMAGLAAARRGNPLLYLVQWPLISGATIVVVALQVSIYLETLAIKGGGPAGHLDEVFA